MKMGWHSKCEANVQIECSDKNGSLELATINLPAAHFCCRNHGGQIVLKYLAGN